MNSIRPPGCGYALRRALLCASALLGAWVFSFDTSQGMEFSLHANNRSPTLNAIMALGPVVTGDKERLDDFLSTLPDKPHTAIYLASLGGDLYEGMRLGELFRERGIKTVVEGGADCASACAIAFLGGTDSQGRPWRSSSTNSRLGFHAFTGGAVDTDEIQRVVSDILRYGVYVDAPTELLIVNFATPSNEIFWVSDKDLCKLGIKLWSVATDSFACNG